MLKRQAKKFYQIGFWKHSTKNLKFQPFHKIQDERWK